MPNAIALGAHLAARQQVTGVITLGAFLFDPGRQQIETGTGVGIGKGALGIGLELGLGDAKGALGDIGLSLEGGGVETHQHLTGLD